jgi:hypothetical protein
MTSLPPSPAIWSLDGEPQMTSSPGVPTILPAPVTVQIRCQSQRPSKPEAKVMRVTSLPSTFMV